MIEQKLKQRRGSEYKTFLNVFRGQTFKTTYDFNVSRLTVNVTLVKIGNRSFVAGLGLEPRLISFRRIGVISDSNNVYKKICSVNDRISSKVSTMSLHKTFSNNFISKKLSNYTRINGYKSTEL